jgi:hypothetical protein
MDTLVADFQPSRSELPQHWIALPPQHFYGGEVVMRASSFQKLKVPGKYRVQGKYSSRGSLAEDINDPPMHYSEEPKKLPYEVWAGTVETNSIWIEVSNNARKAHRVKSTPGNGTLQTP